MYRVKIGGLMGVPVSYIYMQNRTQFSIHGTIGAGGEYNVGNAIIHDDNIYKRVLIRREDVEQQESA